MTQVMTIKSFFKRQSDLDSKDKKRKEKKRKPKCLENIKAS